MARKPLSDEDIKVALDAVARTRNKTEAAQLLGIPRQTLVSRLKVAEERGMLRQTVAKPEGATLGEVMLPTEDLDIDSLWEQRARSFERRTQAKEAQEFYTVRVKENLPIGINWFGDPHLDDNGCHIPLLQEHIRIVTSTPGMVGANIGDLTNNWVGRLERLYAEQEVPRSVGMRLARDFLLNRGIEWLLWLVGNHDAWNYGHELLKQMTQNIVPLHDWQAKIRLQFPGGAEVPIWAAHDFKGHSDWNSLHALMKIARITGLANLYICGHRHTFASTHSQDPHRGNVWHGVRVRGYKFDDSHADNGFFGRQTVGASVVTIINPLSRTQEGVITIHPDVEQGADYLTWLRSKV